MNDLLEDSTATKIGEGPINDDAIISFRNLRISLLVFLFVFMRV